MKHAAFVALVGLIVLLVPEPAALAKGPPLLDPNPERGSVAVSAKIGQVRADQAWFVRVEEEEDLAAAEFVIASNYSRGNQVFLLNVKPGRYVLVGVQGFNAVSGYVTKGLLPREDIAKTEVMVEAGGMAFMGEIQMKRAEKAHMKHADPAQSHYLRLIDPKSAKQGAIMSAWLRSRAIHMATLKELERDTDCERRFLAQAIEKSFKKETVWRELAGSRLAALDETRPG